MMLNFNKELVAEINQIKKQNLYKSESVLQGSQGAEIIVNNRKLLNFCSNNYLGLANNPKVLKIAQKALEKWGYGLSSVRFICGTQAIHKQLEKKVSQFLKTEDTILYTSCFDANTGFFETLTNKEDVIISDELNHASLIDGIRLSKAERKIFKHMDMGDLERKLKESQNHRRRIICTDGVFSMDGDFARLDIISRLAEKNKALIMVDDSHAIGFIGKHGRGTPELFKVEGKIDIITGTFGKALGGLSGGFTSGRKEIINFLRQRSRPYLFSNSLAPMVTATSIAVFDLIQKNKDLRKKLDANTKYFRDKIYSLGFEVRKSSHPIVPIMLYKADLAQKVSAELLKEGIYVIGFYYPVVPEGQARIRVQISAAHQKKHLDQALQALSKVGKKYKII